MGEKKSIFFILLLDMIYEILIYKYIYIYIYIYI